VTYGVLSVAASSSGIGLAGQATALTGATIGVRAINSSPDGTAAIFDALGGGKILSGRTTGYVEKFSVDGTGKVTAAGAAVSGSNATQIVSVSQGGSGNGIAASTTASGSSPTALKAAIIGTATGSNAAGVEGISSDPNGIGVVAGKTATTGTAPALVGTTNTADDGIAVYAEALSPTGSPSGVYAEVNSPGATAGKFNNQNGGLILEAQVNGHSASPTTFFSVNSVTGTYVKGALDVETGPPSSSSLFNVNSINGTYVKGPLQDDGDLNVNGTLNVRGTKNFKIDDPLDPAHKLLYHASVESSEMMNMYTGNVTTDAHGDAVVELPAWFQALNRDFRYQLTVIGQFAQAIVAQEIRNNRFTIRTDKAKVKVSWQVTGVRHDAYANAHPLQVEVDKPERAQ
jgi:hypothetical protein